MTDENAAINVEKLIDSEPLSLLQIYTLVLTSLAIIIEGFDIQALAFAGPQLIAEWGLTKTQFGAAAAAALIGMAIGSPIGGLLGDRVGRRGAVTASALWFGLLTLAIAGASNLETLIGLRFICGLAFGSLMPNAIALLAEWMPARYRTYATSIMIIGIPIGGMIGAAFSSWALPIYGWRICFILGGLLGILLAALVHWKLPESLRFLVRRGREDLARALIARAFRQYSNATFAEEGTQARAKWNTIFTAPHRRVTLGLALAFFANLFAAFAFFNWIPTVLVERGLDLKTALEGAFIFNLFGGPGAVMVAALMSRLGSRAGLVLVVMAAIISVFCLAALLHRPDLSIVALMVCLAAAGATVAGFQSGLYALAATAYPTECRSAGIGAVVGTGRIGAMCSALAGGAILSMAGGDYAFFGAIAVMLVVAAIGVGLVNRHIGRSR
jgi:AAHS family 4-hydroxybenzoate transporter-like MFS transporter